MREIDRLTGGNGNDVFAFTTASGRGNVDVITDMVSGADLIVLDNAAIHRHGRGCSPPTPSSSAPARPSMPTTASFTTAPPERSFRRRRQWRGAAVQFATLQTMPAIVATDFFVLKIRSAQLHAYRVAQVDGGPGLAIAAFIGDADVPAAELDVARIGGGGALVGRNLAMVEQIDAPALLAARRDVERGDRLAGLVDDDEIEIGRAFGQLAAADAVAFGLDLGGGLRAKRQQGGGRYKEHTHRENLQIVIPAKAGISLLDGKEKTFQLSLE